MFCRKHECRWVGCLLWLATALLGILLLIQIPLVLLLTLDRQLTIPAQWVEKAINLRLDDGYSVTLDSATLDQWGTATLKGVSVQGPTDRTMMRAASLQVAFQLHTIVVGILAPRQVQASEVELLDSSGPLGSGEPILTLKALNLIRQPESWEVDDARIRFGDLTMAISGRLHPKDWAVPTPEEGEDPLPGILESIQRVRDQVQRLKDPFLKIHLAAGPGSGTRARLTLIADRVDLPLDLRIEDDVRLTCQSSIEGGRLLPGPIRLRARQIFYGNEIHATNPSLEVDLGSNPSPGAILAHSNVRLTAQSLVSPTVNLQNVSLIARAGPNFSAILDAQADLFSNPFSLHGEVHPLLGSARLVTEGNLSIDEVQKHPLVPAEVRDFRIRFPQGVYLRTTTFFRDRNLIPEEIQFLAKSESFDVSGFTGLHARGQGRLYPQTRIADVEALSVQKKDYHMAGTYRQDFLSNQFRFQIEGGLMPMDLSGWMRNWWDEMWADFVINEVPHINLDLHGDWDHHDDRSLFGGVRFRDIALKGTEISRGYTRIRSRPYLFEVIDLHAFRPEGQLGGYFGILIDPRSRDTRARIYDIESTFGFDQIAPLFGEELAEPLSAFQLTAPPKLRIHGALYPPIAGKDSPTDSLRVDAATDQPLTYRDIQLDRLRLSAHYSEDTLRIDPLYFGLGRGVGKGWIVQRPEGTDQGRTSMRLDFTGGIPSAVVAALPPLADAMKNRIEAEENPDRKEHNLDFSIECSGDPDQPETLLGEGKLSLLSPNLANVRLLGVLSRISEEIPLPITLGSFQFERASTSFLLNRGLVEFSDLTLYSPSSRVVASGAYDMSDETMDFNAQMQILGQSKIPILAQLGALLNPVGKIFEFRIWGKVNDPQWRLYLDPRSW